MGFAGRTARIALANGEWRKGRVELPGPPERAVAASGAWTADDTYVAKLCLPETPFTLTITLRFADGQVTYEQKFRFGFKQQKPLAIVGRAARL